MATNIDFIYLHGFASSPTSGKARFFQQQLKGKNLPIRVPDLNVPSFAHITLSAMIERLRQEVQASKADHLNLIGSSMGCAVALHFMDRAPERERIAKLLLLAPAFDFLENRRRQLGEAGLARWKETGSLTIYHYGFERDYEVGYELIEDLTQYDSYRVGVNAPIFIVHGLQDASVSYQQSIRFTEGRENVSLLLTNADHQLNSDRALALIWKQACQFFDIG